jgi:DNA-binding HxlR family transcriptional regulator
MKSLVPRLRSIFRRSRYEGKRFMDAAVTQKCSRQELEEALSVVEGKWKALIICELMTKDSRYHELEKSLAHISRRILTYELRFLERKGIVRRSSPNTSMRGVEYSLTTRGRALNGVLLELASWGSRVDATS